MGCWRCCCRGGTVVYVRGELQATEEVPLDTAWEATQKAMGDLKFATTSKAKDALAGELIARRASGKKVTVKLKRQSNTLTEIRIRVGIFGDEPTSHEIHKAIKKHF
jgi:hypothetical protein